MTLDSTRSDDTVAALPVSDQWSIRHSRWEKFLPRFVIFGPVIIYLVLALAGLTSSNIGTASLREDPEQPLGVQLGAAQSIRIDEYGTESPIWLGQLARNGAEAITPLSVSDDFFAQLPSGPVGAVVFFDGTALGLGAWLPQQMLFAAKWWLPTLLLFIGLPVWFRQITGKLRWGYLAAALAFVAPATAWWSGRPVNTLGFIAAGCALAIYGVSAMARRAWVAGIVAIIVAGILLARFPTYYQPLAIVVGVPMIVATAAFVLGDATSWRRRLIALGSIAVSGAVWTGLLFWENRESVTAGLATVYPGDRKSTGEALDIGRAFSATNLGWLERLDVAAPLNQSEVATSFTVLLLVVAVMFVASRWDAGRRQAAVIIPFIALGFFWLSWCTFNWGSLGSALPLINRVPNSRAAQGVGYIAIVAFCLYMAQWRAKKRAAAPVVAAALTAFVSGWAGSALQQTALPGLSVGMIWGSALIAALVIYALIRWPERWWPFAITISAATAITITATPLLFGLGDLRTSSTARSFMAWGAESRSDGSLWASESQSVDSLMTATGTPSLSARQQVGPDAAAWEELDPGGAHEDLWNRGGLHIQFEWSSAPGITFSQPSPDVVVLTASPCTVGERMPHFRYAVSSEPLTASCLREHESFDWSGTRYMVYELTS